MKYSGLIVSLVSLFNILWFKIEIVEGILGGHNAEENHFPYHVAVLINNRYACGGAIIDLNFIVTAAQCIVGVDGNFLNAKLSILAGTIYLDGQQPGRVLVDVVKAYIPYDFRPPSRRVDDDPSYLETGDIAVLKLRHYLLFSPNFNNLQILEFPQRRRWGTYDRFMHKVTNITGFGKDTPTESIRSTSNLDNLLYRPNLYRRLKYGKVVIDRKPTCIANYPKMLDAHICGRMSQPLTRNIAGSCFGDIGGPLVLEEKTILGVLVKYSRNCNERDIPAVYTRITDYLKFIEKAKTDDQTESIRVADYVSSDKVLEVIHPARNADIFTIP